MRLSVDKLRVWLLLAAALLVCVIAVFLGYAQYRMHRVVRDIPRRLGMDIQQETNHFTYVQTMQGRTIFSIHAAKMVQMKTGGKVSLHDVDITLYGGKGDRTDHISGSEFDYDTVNQVMTAKGEVHIDLQAPTTEGNASPSGKISGKKTTGKTTGKSGGKPGADSGLPAAQNMQSGAASGRAGVSDAMGPEVIHVTTSGLVFLEKLAVAATSEEMEFQFNGVTGHAHGAEYDSDKGLLILQSAVQMNTLSTGRPVVLTASHAELMRDSNQAVLTNAAYVSPDVDGKSQSGSAQSATIQMRSDGTIERVDASGDVTLKSENGGTVSAPQARATMNEESQPQAVDLLGGVRFDSASQMDASVASQPAGAGFAGGEFAGVGLGVGGEQAHGVAQQAHIVFGAKGLMQQVRLLHAVRLAERVAENPSNGPSTERDLSAEDVRISFAPGANGRPEARLVKAIGSSGGAARMVVTSRVLTGGIGKSAGPAAVGGRLPSRVALQQLQTERTLLSADELDADLTSSDGATRFSRIQGTGHTVFTQEAADGSTQTSTGDRLDLKLAPGSAPAGQKAAGQKAASASIASAPCYGECPPMPQRQLRGMDGAPGSVSEGRMNSVGAGAGMSAGMGAGMDVESATQQGHVHITQTPAPSSGHAAAAANATNARRGGIAQGPQSGDGATTATAELAQYHGASQQLELTGSPQVEGGGMTLWAKKIVLARLTGDVAATGDVKGSLARQENPAPGHPAQGNHVSGNPAAGAAAAQAQDGQTHIVADRALLRHAEQKAYFYGSKSRDARLWQGASQVQAPVLLFDQASQTLTARAGDTSARAGDTPASAGSAQRASSRAVVHAVFLSAASNAAASPATARPAAPTASATVPSTAPLTAPASGPAKSGTSRKAPRAPGGAASEVVRIASREMVYSDQKHEADFSGAVVVESADGSMRASSAVVALQAPAAGAKLQGLPVGIFGGSVERVVAQGDVSLDQPGRKATGDRLTYTAADGEFKLTGTSANLPRLVDQVNGTVTGVALIFHSGDDSVVISSGASNEKVRTRTETTVKNE